MNSSQPRAKAPSSGAAVSKESKKAALTKTVLLQEYRRRVRDNVKSIADNFTEIIRIAKTDDFSGSKDNRQTRFQQEFLEIEVRTASLVRSVESLLKLVSDLKQFVVLNDFAVVNEALDRSREGLQHERLKADAQTAAASDDARAIVAAAEQHLLGGRVACETLLPSVAQASEQ